MWGGGAEQEGVGLRERGAGRQRLDGGGVSMVANTIKLQFNTTFVVIFFNRKGTCALQVNVPTQK